MNEKNRSNKRSCSDTRLKHLVETESEQIFEQALVRMDACSDRRDCSYRNHQHRDVAVLSPIIDLIEEGLSVLGTEVVSFSWILVQRLGCFLEENGVSFLIKV